MWGQGSSEAGQVWPSDSEPGHLPTTPSQGALAGSDLWWGEHSASPSTASLCTAAVAALVDLSSHPGQGPQVPSMATENTCKKKKKRKKILANKQQVPDHSQLLPCL